MQANALGFGKKPPQLNKEMEVLYEDTVNSDRDIMDSEALKMTARSDGIHHFCLKNTESAIKHVRFDLIVEKADHRVDQMTFDEKKTHAKGGVLRRINKRLHSPRFLLFAAAETLSHIAESTAKVHGTLLECAHMQVYHRLREALHRNGA
jgi:hypothetical protein